MKPPILGQLIASVKEVAERIDRLIDTVMVLAHALEVLESRVKKLEGEE